MFKICEVRFIAVPKLDEMSISNMLPMVKDDEQVRIYMPDEYFTGKMPDRTFFFNTISTLYPGFLEQLLSHANKQRTGDIEEKQKMQTILATDEWLENLNEIPFYSKVSPVCKLINNCIYRKREDVCICSSNLRSRSKLVEKEESLS